MSSPALPLPRELIHLILEELSASHTCRSCFQQDVLSLAQTSREINAVATPWLYNNICLRPHDVESTYERRLSLLIRTLSENEYLGSLVKRVRFVHEHPATDKRWAELAAHTPNLEILQGVDTFFKEPEHEDEEADELVREENEVAQRTLCGLKKLKQTVVHQEILPCAVSTLLTSWPEMETLVLGSCHASADPENDEAEYSYGDLTWAFTRKAGFPGKLRNVYFHDCDFDSNHPTDRAKLLPSLPQLDRLGIEYTLGLTLEDVTNFLAASRKHAERLHTLDFHRQLRKHNSLSSIVELLRNAEGLKRLSLGLNRYPSDDLEEQPAELLASESLEELRWVPTYMRFATPADFVSTDDEFNNLLRRSLQAGSLPNLKSLTVGHELVNRGDPIEGEGLKFEVYEMLDKLVEDGLLNAPGKPKLVIEHTEGSAEAVRARRDATEAKVSGLKRGVHGVSRRCDVGKDEDAEIEEVDQVGKEELWGEGDEGDLLGLWIAARV